MWPLLPWEFLPISLLLTVIQYLMPNKLASLYYYIAMRICVLKLQVSKRSRKKFILIQGKLPFGRKVGDN